MNRSFLMVAVLAVTLPAFSDDPKPPQGGGDEEGETFECPFCHQPVTIPNTPAGAWMKVKIAVASENRQLLKDCLIGYDPAERAEPGAAVRVLQADLVKVEEEGDKATLVLMLGNNTIDVPALKDDGTWKVDVRQIKEQQQLQGCRGNIQQIGQRIRNFSAHQKTIPGSGEALWTDLKVAGLLDIRFLNCPHDAARVTQEEFDAADWKHVSYAVTGDELGEKLDAMKPLVWEKNANHGGKREVLLASGSVVDMTQEQFDAAMKKFEGVAASREGNDK